MPDASDQQALARFAPDAVLSFNADGVGLDLGAPHLTWMVDEPYYQPHWTNTLRAPNLRTLWTNDQSRAYAETMSLVHPPERLDVAARGFARSRTVGRRQSAIADRQLPDAPQEAEAGSPGG